VIPPLRERPDDIPMLAYRFAMRTAADVGKEVSGIAPESLQLLQQYPWPGNVRELQHAVERGVILSHDAVLQPHAFEAQRAGMGTALAQQAMLRAPAAHSNGADGAHAAAALPPGAIVLSTLNVEEAERALIKRALELTKNNRTKTAELLGISVRTLRNKLNGSRVAEEEARG
jgi:DNA-binding NtrC family response regulator